MSCRHDRKQSGFLKPTACLRALKRLSVASNGNAAPEKAIGGFPVVCMTCGNLCFSPDALDSHSKAEEHVLWLSLEHMDFLCTRCTAGKGNNFHRVAAVVNFARRDERLDKFLADLETWLKKVGGLEKLRYENVALSDDLKSLKPKASGAVVKDKKKKANEEQPKEGNTSATVAPGSAPLDDPAPMSGKLHGIANVGNTCFFNSVLQVLAHSKSFIEEVNRVASVGEEAADERPELDVEFLLSFSEILAAVKEGNVVARTRKRKKKKSLAFDNSVHPGKVLDQIVGRLPQFSGFMQQDAHELLVEVLRTLEEDEKGIFGLDDEVEEQKKEEESSDAEKQENPDPAKSTFVNKLFSCEMNKIVTCLHCKHSTTRKEEMVALSVDIPEQRADSTIENCISCLSTPVMLLEAEDNGLICDKCSSDSLSSSMAAMSIDSEPTQASSKVKRDASLCEQPSRAPPVLIVHLKRFRAEMNGDELVLKKIKRHVGFGERLEFEIAMEKEDEDCDEEVVGTELCDYELYGVVVHRGHNMSFGHYTCYVRLDGKWWFASDETIYRARIDEVLECQPYMLFYSRIN